MARKTTKVNQYSLTIDTLIEQAKAVSQIYPVNLGGYWHVLNQNGLVVVNRRSLEAILQTLENSFQTIQELKQQYEKENNAGNARAGKRAGTRKQSTRNDQPDPASQ